MGQVTTAAPSNGQVQAPDLVREAAAGQPVSRGYDPGPLWARLLPPLAALGMALWSITRPSFWRDEAATISAIRRPFGDMIVMLGNVDAVHSAYYITMWPLAHLFGYSELVLRLPSALAMALTAATIAAIGRRLISPWAGLSAGLLYAIVPVATRYGQEARPYATVVAIATIASYLLVRLLAAEPAKRRRWLVAYAAGLGALGVVNIFGLLLIPAHAVTVGLTCRREPDRATRRRLAAGWLAAAVAGIVVAGPLLDLGWRQRGQISWLAVNKSTSGVGTLLTLTGSILESMTLAGVVVIALVLSTAKTDERRRAAWPRRLWDLSLPWIILPPLILWVSTFLLTPVYTSRYILLCVPAITLLAGAGVAAVGRFLGPVAIATVLVAGGPYALEIRGSAGHSDDIRAIDQIVAGQARPGDVVLYTNPNAESFGAAYPMGLGKLPNVALGRAAIPSGTLAGTTVSLAQIQSRLSHVSRVFVVEIGKCVTPPVLLGLNGAPVTIPGPAGTNVTGPPVLQALPFHFVRMWQQHQDWLLLYAKGPGSQAVTGLLATACKTQQQQYGAQPAG
jgi:mannosyltransferase